ncbi:MAG: radical SAM protein [Polyangiaceae bacterium]|nr:radical SAM protein [Polyangiaceae bacterium]
MRCRFCFATFEDVIADRLPRGHLAREDACRTVDILARRFRKVTFAGGEPTLCPWLDQLVDVAHRAGATTMLVTNGSRLHPGGGLALAGKLDWIALSLDSASDPTHARLGRALHGEAIPADQHVAAMDAARRAGVRLKVNTVVTALNAGEDMSALIARLRPERWKILQVLPVEGQNSGRLDGLICSPEAFHAFVERHRGLERQGIRLVPEENEDMRGSYAMVDPAGRFFDNTGGGHRYSAPILEVGIDRAWSEVAFRMGRFLGRGGDYDFDRRGSDER